MDLIKRKYSFIQEIIKLDNEKILDKLEEILGKVKATQFKVTDVPKIVAIKPLEEQKINPKRELDWYDMLTD